VSASADRRFVNHFAAVIVLLHVVVIGFFFLARTIGARTQEEALRADPMAMRAATQRIAPFAREAVAGADNSALVAQDEAATSQAAKPKVLELNGQQTFDLACHLCHATGVSGAPRFGNQADWAPRLAKGKNVLYQHALQGFQGQKGVMPPKGGRPDLSDHSVRAAVDLMASRAG